LVAAGVIYAASQHGAYAADPCAYPDDILGTLGSLPHAASALKPGGTLRVLTVGSATVFSPTESLVSGTVTAKALGLGSALTAAVTPVATAAGFPMQMAAALRQAYPKATVEVTVKGGRGIAAADMLDIIQTELAATHYQLVIWQTGTVEAVRNTPPAAFFETLSEGAATIADAGSDLILVDPQYSRFLNANADVDPYEQTLQTIAAQPGVALFRRFDLMRFWATESQIDLERTPRSQRHATVEMLHVCLGRALARLVAAGSKQQS